jgi:hypothetical protein
MKFFKKKSFLDKKKDEKPASLPKEDIDIEHPSSEKEKKIVQEALKNTDAAIEQAAKIVLKDIKLLEEGRCINCGKKVNQHLDTYICKYCGWFSYAYPKEEKTRVHLKDQTVIVCDRIYTSNTNDILCLRDGVVIARAPKENLNYIEMLWSDDELEEKYKEEEKKKNIICDWCSKNKGKTDSLRIEVAFGYKQEIYYFCEERCLESFKKKYPPRIHRNCYNNSCYSCDECIKKQSKP